MGLAVNKCARYLVVLCLTMLVACSSSSGVKGALTISDESLLNTAVAVFTSQTGATALGIVTYDFDRAKQTITYLFPSGSRSLDAADIKLGKSSDIAQFNDVYQAHLAKACYWRTPIRYRDFSLGLNFRVSLGVYVEDNPQPKGYIVVWFPDLLSDNESRSICKSLTSLRSKI